MITTLSKNILHEFFSRVDFYLLIKQRQTSSKNKNSSIEKQSRNVNTFAVRQTCQLIQVYLFSCRPVAPVCQWVSEPLGYSAPTPPCLGTRHNLRLGNKMNWWDIFHCWKLCRKLVYLFTHSTFKYIKKYKKTIATLEFLINLIYSFFV